MSVINPVSHDARSSTLTFCHRRFIGFQFVTRCTTFTEEDSFQTLVCDEMLRFGAADTRYTLVSAHECRKRRT